MEGLRLKDVAERVGIRPPSIFSHFDGRDAIARGVADRVVASLLAATPFGPGDDPADYLRRWTRRLASHLADNPAHVRLLFRELMQAGVAGKCGEASRADPRGLDSFFAAVETGIAAGAFRPVRPSAALAQLLGAMLANVAWEGWHEDGRPRMPIPVADYERESEELLMGYLLR